MSAICGEHSMDIWKKLIKSDRTDYKTATYLLLLDRKLRGFSLKMVPITRSYLRTEMAGVTTFLFNIYFIIVRQTVWFLVFAFLKHNRINNLCICVICS